MVIKGNVKILDAKKMERTLTRIAHEILERNKSVENLALVGIRTRGVPLARRLAEKIKKIEKVEVDVGTLDINLYRDDWSMISDHPVLKKTEIPFQIDDKKIGYALFSSKRVRKPTYISPGHKISFETSIDVVKNLSFYKHPEPLRQAHILAKKSI